jgi:hypothetical protein
MPKKSNTLTVKELKNIIIILSKKILKNMTFGSRNAKKQTKDSIVKRLKTDKYKFLEKKYKFFGLSHIYKPNFFLKKNKTKIILINRNFENILLNHAWLEVQRNFWFIK